MQLEEVAKALKELGHPTRLFIFKHLVKAGNKVCRSVSCKAAWDTWLHTQSPYISTGIGRAGQTKP